MPITLRVTGPYTAKDQAKASRATKFIGCGSARSSTNSYANDFGVLANCGDYTEHDVVFVSAEGARSGRCDPPFHEIELAVIAGATLLTDTLAHRQRPYNCGERQVSDFLQSLGCAETAAAGYSEWRARPSG